MAEANPIGCINTYLVGQERRSKLSENLKLAHNARISSRLIGMARMPCASEEACGGNGRRTDKVHADDPVSFAVQPPCRCAGIAWQSRNMPEGHDHRTGCVGSRPAQRQITLAAEDSAAIGVDRCFFREEAFKEVIFIKHWERERSSELTPQSRLAACRDTGYNDKSVAHLCASIKSAA